MKAIETIPNRFQQRAVTDIAPLFDAIIGHRLRGWLSSQDMDALQQASPARLRLFLLSGDTPLYPITDIQLPLDVIQSSQRQNSHGFYLHRVTGQTETPKLHQAVYHASATPASETSYTLGFAGSMTEIQNPYCQAHLHQLVEALRASCQYMDEAIARIHQQLADPQNAILVSSQSGQILTANGAAIRIARKSLHDLVGTDCQTILESAAVKAASGKHTLTTIPLGSQTITVVLLANKQAADALPPSESTKFLFQLLRDKIAICNIASEYLGSVAPIGIDAGQKELTNSLTHELQDMAYYLVRAEMLVTNNWNVAGRHNLTAQTALAVQKATLQFPRRHSIRIFSPERNIYCHCAPMGIEVALETIFWLHLREQEQPTITTINFDTAAHADSITLSITTTAANNSPLRPPKQSWQTYLTDFGARIESAIETTQETTTGAITTNMQCLLIKE